MIKKYKKVIRILIILFLIFFIQAAVFTILNIPFVRYYEENEIKEYKTRMNNFSLTHQNIKSGLFVNPDISSSYYAVGSVNFTIANELTSDIIDPKNNDYLQENQKDFFLEYFLEKQNEDGSFSDIVGLGEMESTYQVLHTIDRIDNNSIHGYPHIIENLYAFLNNTMENYGWGFKHRGSSQEADIISTFYGIKIAERFNFTEITNNENMTKFINSTFTGMGYQYSPTIPLINPETTFFGINAYLSLNNVYPLLDLNSIYFYLSGLYNSTDGSYSQFPGKIGDIKSTHNALECLDLLGFAKHDNNKTYEFIMQCFSSDGGFVKNPYQSNSTDFESGWAATNSYNLLSLNNTQKEGFKLYLFSYYNWLSDHQAKNGLFGNITLEANYFGVLSTHLAYPEEFSQHININSIDSFINSCYNLEDGGYGAQKNELSTLYDTFLAINLYKIINSYHEIVIPNSIDTIDFIANHQNDDGGFRLGHGSFQLYTFFGPYSIILEGVLEENTSLIQNSYWAIYCLDHFNALDRISINDLKQWTLACQNADGGFSFKVGFISDIVSTFYGLKLLKILDTRPLSILTLIKFIQDAQTQEGSFEINPLFSDYSDSSPTFLVSYFAVKILYDNNYQVENIKQFKYWYEECLDTKTGGVGDNSYFGPNLRNTPYGIILIDEMRFDRSINPIPYNKFLIYLLIIEISAIVLFIIFKLFSAFFISITQTFTLRLYKGGKLNESYLKQKPAIKCENLSIYVGKKLIVDSISIDVQHGEILGILGESGAGKSTFVKALLGMRKYKGISEIYGMDSKKNAKVFRPIYGYVPQDLSKLYHNVTVIQNLQYFGQQYDLTQEEINLRAENILKELEIEDKKNSLVKNLSGGQKRRVSIALGLIHKPLIAILDEPTSGLDPVVRENLWLTLTNINDKFNTTIIVITHYPEESRFCNKVAIFGRKRGLIDYGKPVELLSQLPGEGRAIVLSFKSFQKNATLRLEKIDSIEKVLENKTGIDFSVYSDLNVKTIRVSIEGEFGKDSIEIIRQTDARMEQYFRYKSMVIFIE